MSRPTHDKNSRAVTPILGLTLLIGIVATASIGVLLIGTSGLDSTTDDVKNDRVESSFVQFSKDVNTVSTATTSSREIDLGTEEAVRKEDTGRITIETSNKGVIANESVGSIEYENDGSIVSYQAGGVWRGTGRETQMVSAPDMSYRDGTLNMPIMKVDGEERLTKGETKIQKNRSQSALNGPSYVQGELVTITIESKYYVGWAEFFETRTSDTAVTVHHSNDTTIVDLGQPHIGGNFDHPVITGQNVTVGTAGNPCVGGTIVTGGTFDNQSNCNIDSQEGQDIDLQPLDDAINLTVDNVDKNTTVTNSTSSVDSGTYFVDGEYKPNQDTTLNVTDGNVTIVVDGNIALSGNTLEVDRGGTDNIARVVTTGDVGINNGGGGVSVSDGNATAFQLYGTSEMHFAIGQGDFTGAVYAPRDDPASGDNEVVDKYNMNSADCHPGDANICIGTGSPTFNGSIIAGETEIAQATHFGYDPNLADANPSLPFDGIVFPPDVIHMRIVSHEMDVTSG